MSRRVVSVLANPCSCALGAALALLAGCVEQAEEKPTQEDMDYVKKNLLGAPPAPQFVVNADLDGKVSYVGLDVSPNPVEPGKDVKLTHYWKVNTAPGEGWRMFTHLNGPNKQGFINIDHGPVRGKYPVQQWKAGDIIRDEHGFRLPPTWTHDRIEVYVGLWRRNERMTIKVGPRDDAGRVLAASVPVKRTAPPPPPKRYVVRKSPKPIKIDGKLDEPAWKGAPSTGIFVNTLSGAPAEVKTEAKLLWDDQHLYLAFENQDTDIWSNLTKRDDKLWTQEAVEIMIDADGNKKTYVELQVAPNGTILDTYLPEYRKYEDTADPKRKQFDWSSKMKAKVVVEGTLNKRDDQDKSWTVEIALPLGDVNGLQKEGVKVPPAFGEVWRLNLFRMDAPEGKPQIAAGWSAPMVPDFHALEKFGEILFADEKGEVPPPPAMAAGTKEAVKGALGGIQQPPTAPGAAVKIEGAKAPAVAKGKSGEPAKK